METETQFEKLNSSAELICTWYRKNKRSLPWREDQNPYKIWISEIMLQQTRISAVLDYYARFMNRLPDISSLASVSEDELLKLWQGLGYYNRARNLQKAAQKIVCDYQGKFPADYEQIRALPGIGDYTAGAIASFAFGLPVPAVDGNVLRVLTRVLGDASDVAKEKTKKDYREYLLPVLKQHNPSDLNQGIMELGETVCLPNGEPLCSCCPLEKQCYAHQQNKTDVLPVKSSAKPRKIENRIIFLFFSEGRAAICRRPEKGLLAGLYEYPNCIETEASVFLKANGFPLSVLETAQEAASGVHIFSHIEWHMKAYVLNLNLKLPDGWIWADKKELNELYAIPNAFQFVWNVVSEHLA